MSYFTTLQAFVRGEKSCTANTQESVSVLGDVLLHRGHLCRVSPGLCGSVTAAGAAAGDCLNPKRKSCPPWKVHHQFFS